MYARCPSGKYCCQTLVFYTYYSCADTIAGSRTHNHTTYSVCFLDGQCICFHPIYRPREQRREVQSFTSTGKLVNPTRVSDPTNLCPYTLMCVCAIAENTRPWDNCGGGVASLGKDLQVK
jgi:hypothetical protein